MGSKIVMQCVGLAIGSACGLEGQYLEGFDPDAHHGLGEAFWTPDKNKALPFADVREAMELWRKPSTVRPLRPDGKPNRPLTAFTVTFETIETGDLH
jgi:hypothetical protein